MNIATPRLKKRLIAIAYVGVVMGMSFSSLYAQEKDPRWFPDIPGYKTLAGDFHMHTVFSDGHVWPTLRVQEAARDGLDVISITEHTDYEGYADDIERNRERGYEIAAEEAKKRDILLIKGVEISPRVAPYHNNVLFATDLDAFPYGYMKDSKGTFVMKDNIQKSELLAPFEEAEKQGAFVFYNHPSYGWWVPSDDRELFTDIHQDLLKRGLLGGVEVVNGGRYNVIAHRMAMKYNLTMFGNSDAHWGLPENSRPITIVLAKDKSQDAIKEAIINRRTAVYSDNILIGRHADVDALFKASLNIIAKKIDAKNRPQLQIAIYNKSDMDFEVNFKTDYILDHYPLGKATLKSKETTTLLLDAVWEYPESTTLKVEVQNIVTSPEEHLVTELVVPVK